MALHTFVVVEIHGDEEPAVILHTSLIQQANEEALRFRYLNPDRTFYVLLIPPVRKLR